MSYRFVKGGFHLTYQGKMLVRSQPDGDSMWFKPDDPKLLGDIDGRSADYNGGGFTQLRFEAIDALEIHYRYADCHQEFDHAKAARNFLLDTVGFTQYDFPTSSGLHVGNEVPDRIAGWIATRAIDPYGRPVAFVFKGDCPFADGAEEYLKTTHVKKSFNAKLATEGHAYPAYYASLPWELREYIDDCVDVARSGQAGLWGDDTSGEWNAFAGMTKLRESVVWPKLFRRLAEFYNTGGKKLSEFDAWLQDDQKERDDKVWLREHDYMVNLHDVVEVKDEKIRMTYAPENLIVMPS
jgi:endonuclease YncB( thermonuclease family)